MIATYFGAARKQPSKDDPRQPPHTSPVMSSRLDMPFMMAASKYWVKLSLQRFSGAMILWFHSSWDRKS